MKKLVAGACLLFGSFGAQASGFDVALSNETANLQLLLNPYQFYQGGGSELAVGGFFSEQGDKLAHATLMARGYQQSERSQYSLGAGVKLIAGDIAIPNDVSLGGEDKESVGALALGFQGGLLLASSRQNPLELSFEGFFAPSITSFSDAEQFSEIGARLQIEVIPQAKAYVGYRRMRFDTNDYSQVRLDRSVHIGIKLTF